MQDYRERVIPPLWGFLLTLLLAPAAMIIFLPLNRQLGWVVAVLLVALACLGLFLASPRISVEQGMLRAGRAAIPVEELGEAGVLDRDAARAALGVEFDPGAYHATTPWAHRMVRVDRKSVV